jgi:hypothetical protein
MLDKEFMVFLKKDAKDCLTFRVFEDPKNERLNVNLYDIKAKSTGVELSFFSNDELKTLIPKFFNDVVIKQLYEEIPSSEYFKECFICTHRDCIYNCDNFNRILYFRSIGNV